MDNPVELASNLEGLRLYLAAGNGKPGPFDPAGTSFDDSEATKFVEFKHMMAALQMAHIPATEIAYGPGVHTFPYWQRDPHQVLPGIMATFTDPPAAPSPWTYRTTERTFDVWGYQGVRADATPGWTILTGIVRPGTERVRHGAGRDCYSGDLCSWVDIRRQRSNG